MAKRLEPGARGLDASDASRSDVCPLCGGAIVAEASRLPEARFPRRRVCLRCRAEYGTTRPALRYG